MADTQPEPWGEDPSLDALLGAPGAAALRVTDVTTHRRTEAELRAYADMVAHDLREPVTSIAHLIALLRRRGEEPPDPQVLDLMRRRRVAGGRRGPVSAWPSAGASSRRTAATSGSSPPRAAAAPFASRCHAERRERTGALGRGSAARRSAG